MGGKALPPFQRTAREFKYLNIIFLKLPLTASWEGHKGYSLMVVVSNLKPPCFLFFLKNSKSALLSLPKFT
jgi:hypothetical protein